ncbi:MAG: proline--tRNA ligase [Thermoanaerobaculia bacterium]|nr:MAG: proline--tRNA ligase [Thermoanaerobaculia bacterium]
MRWSRFYLHTTREAPADAEVVSHVLMVRAGMIKKVAAGIYTYLPAGWRSLSKLMTIVRREMDAAGAIELGMPAIQPAELWIESGRWQKYGKELLRMRDRHEREFCFGPTHEEVITDAVRRDVRSYRQLPFNLYQIQTKFRDEIRPRFGLMRGREFLMKDAYSFSATPESLDEIYEAMRSAYCRVFEACQLDYTMVEADTGTIGGSSSHEFMVTASTGESAVAHCPGCGYGANQEKAERGAWPEAPAAEPEPLGHVGTPGKTSIAEVSEFLELPAERFVKTLVYETDQGELVAVAIRGDREVNEVKLQNALPGALHLRLAPEERVREATGAPVGFAGPVGLRAGIRLLADVSVERLANFVCGANEADAHYVGANWHRDAEPERFTDLVLVLAGDPCPRCGTALEMSRGIEVGHIFKLGSKYSEAMQCVFTDEKGEDRPMIMGCYGLGIGRTVAAAIEQNHDADGIVWPLPLAPFSVLVISLTPNDPASAAAAEALAAGLEERGVDVLLDDRDERPGVKFKDADLVGIPVRAVVGGKSFAAGQAELSLRRDREKVPVPLAEAGPRTLELLERLRGR